MVDYNLQFLLIFINYGAVFLINKLPNIIILYLFFNIDIIRIIFSMQLFQYNSPKKLLLINKS